MQAAADLPEVETWFAANGLQNVTPVEKQGSETRAWFATAPQGKRFVKFYPQALAESWAAIEIAVAGSVRHPSIVPLRQTVACREGTLLLYDRVAGENLGPMAARDRFHALALSERIRAVCCVLEALAAVGEAGFMIVDWYEGNMMYDFAQKHIWLFDWELCRVGGGFELEMASNYGSSRLMAPEEFVRGSWLDQRTLVFNLGRYVLLNLPELADTLAPILARATYPARSERYATIREFTRAFAEALAVRGKASRL